MMFPAAVHVHVDPAAEITVKEQFPGVVALQPTGTVNPLIAPAPLITNNGPVGRTTPVAAGTVAVCPALPGAKGLLNPGTYVVVIEEQIHCAPVTTLT